MIVIDKTKCLECMSCVDNCPILAITYNKKKGNIEVDEKKCCDCGACIDSCPRIAIKFKK